MNTLGNLSKLEQTPKAIFAHYDSGEARIEVFKSGIVHLTVMRGKDEMKSFAVIDSPVAIPASSMKIGKADVELAVLAALSISISKISSFPSYQNQELIRWI